ncbi:TPA: hypothetical protein OQU49_004135 [Shigella flexneri]|nr:hypothetical protein [Shigella flexneri]
MADEQAAPAVESTENTEAVQSDSDALGEGGKKALEAERKRASEAERSAKELQAQIDAINDAKLTETQRLEKQLAELQASYQASQIESARNRVIATEGVPANLADFVTGDSEQALQASARALLSAIAEASKPGTPAPDPSQGAATSGAVGGSTAAQFEAFMNASGI